MKNSFSIALIVAGLFFNIACSTTKEALTTKTATSSKGYTLINPGEQISIYKFMHPSHSPKEAGNYADKYFFTSGSSDTLQELTKTNLKKAFPENHSFHDALDANFTKDSELTNYDEFHKIYKVNRLLENSLK